MDPSEVTDVPFIVILAQAMKIWQKAHEGKVPASFKEKMEFKKSLGEMGDTENFEEAVEHARRVYTRYKKNPSSLSP